MKYFFRDEKEIPEDFRLEYHSKRAEIFWKIAMIFAIMSFVLQLVRLLFFNGHA